MDRLPTATVARRGVMLVFGTRPEAVKLAPLALALAADDRIELTTVVTGQHREMLDPVLELFGIVPDVDLAIMSPRQTLSDVTVRTLERLTPVLVEHAPDVVVVQGDTTAAMVAGLAAFYQDIPVVHLEAGLRSGDLRAPFPEELNRRLTAQLASVHLAPTDSARANLLAEGIDPGRVFVVGNTVIDALLWVIGHPAPYDDPVLDAVDRAGGPVVLVTAHRRESWGDGLRAVGRALAELARSEPAVTFVLPVHRNPVVREALLPALDALPNVVVREPLGYAAFARMLRRCDLVLTDSGGLQEEGPALGKPVLVMRDRTERPEAVEAGGVTLVGTDVDRIVGGVRTLLHDPEAYAAMAVQRFVYGDGRAASRSVQAIHHLLGRGPAPEPFRSSEPAGASR